MNFLTRHKKPVYAPMLATFGGGSVLGFRGAAASIPESFTSTQTVYDTSNKYFGFSKDDIAYHFSHGEYSSATSAIQISAGNGQHYQLGGYHIYPIIVTMSGSAGTASSVWKNCVAMLCLLRIKNTGEAELGPTYRILGVDVHSDLSAANVNATSATNNAWRINHGTNGNAYVYPINYNASSYTSTNFGVMIANRGNDGGGTSYDYLYHATFSANTSTLEITQNNTYNSRVTAGTAFDENTPFTSSSSSRSLNNCDIAYGLYNLAPTAQGCHFIPMPNSDRVGMIFGGVDNWYGQTNWNARGGLFETSSGYADLRAAFTWTSNQVDPLAGGGCWDGNEFIGLYLKWGNNSPMYRVGYNTGFTGVLTSPSVSTVQTTFSNSGNQDHRFSYDPINNQSWNAFRSGTGTVKKMNISNGGYTNSTTDFGSFTEGNNSESGIRVCGEKYLLQDNDKLYKMNQSDSSGSQVSSFSLAANGCSIGGGYNVTSAKQVFGYSNSLYYDSGKSAFLLGPYADSNSATDRPCIMGYYD